MLLVHAQQSFWSILVTKPTARSSPALFGVCLGNSKLILELAHLKVNINGSIYILKINNLCIICSRELCGNVFFFLLDQELDCTLCRQVAIRYCVAYSTYSASILLDVEHSMPYLASCIPCIPMPCSSVTHLTPHFLL